MNGYIAIEINSEKLGIKFGMPANEWFTRKLEEDNSLVGVDGSTSLIGVAYLIFYGYLNNCLHKDIEPTYKVGHFIEWVEEVSIDSENRILDEIGQCYIDSKFTKAWVERIEKATEEVKKKMIGNTLNPSATES
jgi:hypothetical protein